MLSAIIIGVLVWGIIICFSFIFSPACLIGLKILTIPLLPVFLLKGARIRKACGYAPDDATHGSSKEDLIEILRDCKNGILEVLPHFLIWLLGLAICIGGIYLLWPFARFHFWLILCTGFLLCACTVSFCVHLR